jgi:hypothetical protein
MNALLKKSFTLASLLFGESTFVYCQTDWSRYELGLGAGMFVYQGDLTPSRAGSYKTASPAVTVFVNRILSSSFSLRANLAFGKLKGNDAAYSTPSWRQQRNFLFSTPLFEISGIAIWRILQRDQKLSPYAFAGAGFTLLKIRRDQSRFNAEYFANEPEVLQGLATDAAHQPPRVLPVLPIGLGVRYKLTNQLSLTAESAYRLTTTDYLDGFSHAANASLKDHYQSHTVGLIYSLGKKSGIDCPVVK